MVQAKTSPAKTAEGVLDSPFFGFHTVLVQVDICEVFLGAPLSQMVTSHYDIFWKWRRNDLKSHLAQPHQSFYRASKISDNWL